VASLSQGRTAAAQCGLFTHKSVPVIFEPPCIFGLIGYAFETWTKRTLVKNFNNSMETSEILMVVVKERRLNMSKYSVR